MFRELDEAFHHGTGETALCNDQLGERNFSDVGFSCHLVHKSHPQSRVQYNTMFPLRQMMVKKITAFHTHSTIMSK